MRIFRTMKPCTSLLSVVYIFYIMSLALIAVQAVPKLLVGDRDVETRMDDYDMRDLDEYSQTIDQWPPSDSRPVGDLQASLQRQHNQVRAWPCGLFHVLFIYLLCNTAIISL